MSDQDPIVSHGRGGVANIGHDDAVYTDGEIVREGPTGDQGDGAFSTGRGGQGNIGSPKVRATSLSSPGDSEVIPETALRRPSQDNYHVGRGGQGNIHSEEPNQSHVGLADKLKNKIFKKSQEKETSG